MIHLVLFTLNTVGQNRRFSPVKLERPSLVMWTNSAKLASNILVAHPAGFASWVTEQSWADEAFNRILR